MKNLRIIFFAILIASSLMSCNTKNQKKGITIGISYQNLQNEFIINIQDGIRKKAKESGVEIIESDGQGNAENQVSQIENFISLGVDAIILNPFDKNGCAPALDKAVQAGIPVVVLNAVVSNLDKASAYVGSNDEEAGRIAATEIAGLLKGKGNVTILHGHYGHSAEVERTVGIKEVFSKYPDLKIVYEQTANWDRALGLSVTENMLSSGKEIDAVIAQNDEMALGAYKAIEAAGKQKTIYVIGIDAIKDALRSVKENRMVATVFQDAHGQASLAMELAKKLAEKKPVERIHYIPFQLVTKDNAGKFE